MGYLVLNCTLYCMFTMVLYYTVLYWTLYCMLIVVMYCTVLYCTVLHADCGTVLYCTLYCMLTMVPACTGLFSASSQRKEGGGSASASQLRLAVPVT